LCFRQMVDGWSSQSDRLLDVQQAFDHCVGLSFAGVLHVER
jgi:hypothetical protein